MKLNNPLDRSEFLNLEDRSYRKTLADFWDQQSGWDGEDITVAVLGLAGKRVSAEVTAKSAGICAGRAEAEFFLERQNIECDFLKAEMETINSGDTVIRLAGDAAKLLKAERPLLNFLSRFSGIATLAHSLIAKLPQHILLLPTRKTFWGPIDKKAVAVAGGGTHRLSLADAPMVKENHLATMNNDMAEVCRMIDASGASFPFWEIEIENEQQFYSIIEFLPRRRPGVILFDEFPPKRIASLLDDFEKPQGLLLEVSGGITPENIGQYCHPKIDAISAGFLTNNVPPVDFSLRIGHVSR